ncbi:hypothetical protein [Actinokineospora iranica]|uniref:PPE family protein n=1 Tax=Actinokineospora iranica TaxID=1271860 RepID=A0A1G6XYX0_9PSEU|nr:hypothetical protein [Actinokineospora iranica]SDD82873.1 hypothetical protein SAMN05216174_11952 [Actinokineospora iranica]
MAPNGGEHRYGTQEYAGDRAADVQRGQRNMPQEDRSTSHEIQHSIAASQAAKLAPEVRMGDDRVVQPQNWASRTSTELFAAATQINNPTTADTLGRGFNESGNRLVEAANRLYEAVAKLEHAWQGAAADSARQALTPLAAQAGQAGVTAQYMGTAMARQATAAAAVKNLPQPVEFDASTELNKALANPNPIAGMADMAAKAEEAKAVKQEQVTYLENYTQAMTAVDSATPSFVPPETRIEGGGGDGGFRGGGGVDYRNGPGGGADLTPGGSGHTSPSGLTPGGQGGHTPNTPHAPSIPGAQTPGGLSSGTNAAGYTPPSSTTHVPNYSATGANPNLSGQGGGFGGGPFAGGRGGFGPGGGVGGAGGRGGAGLGARGGAGAFSAGDADGRGGRPGGPGLTAAEEAARARQGQGAGTGGRNASGMGAGAGGGRGQGDEDTEHQRPSYLIEPDPEDTFGTDQITAPPVIGQ